MSSLSHFLSLKDHSQASLISILDTAERMKKADFRVHQSNGKVLGMLFFNPSLRTRVSFETAAWHLGATTINTEPGMASWSVETRKGVVMNANKTEHLKETIQVLSEYVDAIGVRAFATKEHYLQDKQDELLHQIVEYAGVPIVNLESAWEHPCQAMADWMTLRETFGKDLSKKTFVLSWAPHPFPLPMAVPNSALMAAARSGMHVRLAAPEGISLDEDVLSQAQAWCTQNKAGFELFTQQDKALEGADVVYAKAWAGPIFYQNPEKEKQLRLETNPHWTLTPELLAHSNQAKIMHCLPVRRNVEIHDAVLDGPNALHIQEAANRLHVQKAILAKLWNISF